MSNDPSLDYDRYYKDQEIAAHSQWLEAMWKAAQTTGAPILAFDGDEWLRIDGDEELETCSIRIGCKNPDITPDKEKYDLGYRNGYENGREDARREYEGNDSD